MKRTMCWLTVITAMVIAACTTEVPPTAARIRRSLGPLVVDSQTATLGTVQQTLKGWGLYPTGENATAPTVVGDSLYTMGATFIRDQLDPTMYDSGTTLSNMTINTTTLNAWIAKWNNAKTHTNSTVTNYVLSVWSPPAAFKTNNSVDGYTGSDTSNLADSSVIGYLIGADEPAFVAYLTKILEDLQSSSVGLPFALSVQNEPTALVNYPGSLYRGSNGAVMWDSVIKNLRGSLDYLGYDTTKIILYGPETPNYGGVSAFFGGAGFPWLTSSNYTDHAVTNYAFHAYYQGTAAVIDSTLTGMADASPKRDSWVTEYSGPAGADPLDYLLNTISDMGAAFVIEPNNYWFWYQGWANAGNTESNGVLMTGDSTNPYPSKRYFALKKVWTSLIPTQWVIMPMASTTDPDFNIGLGSQTSGDPQVDLWAFKKTDSTKIVVMVSNHTTKQKSLTIGTFPSTYSAQHSWMSDSTHDMWQDTSTNVYMGYSTIHIPPRSFKFVVMQ